MTQPVVHLWRLLKWGRTLARHGALRGIERDPNTPAPVRRLARVARFGARVPARPAYADAFQAIGPAAIKLGQTLATRPDLVGEEAAHDLLRLQDQLPPVPFATICAAMEASMGRPPSHFFSSIEEVPVGAASIAQVHRAVTTDGRTVAVKVLRPGVEEDFARAIDTYQWAAAQVEGMSGEAARLRPRLTVENFRRWTLRELNFRREAASASELAESMTAEPDFVVPQIDWARSTAKVLTVEWVDGIKLSNRQALVEAGYDLPHLAQTLVRAFLRQAIAEGFFHADMHQGNLFALPGNKIAAIDFGIMGRIDRRARVWLAEILYGLITGNYKRVAEIHFEAGYVPPHHNVAEFATALRAVGEPMRGLPVKDMSIGMMLDGLFSITRDFDMVTQPHLLLLQKTMVMVEGVATSLDPDINLWDSAAPFVREWIRTELGPEAKIADRLIEDVRTIARLPDLVRRIEARYPAPGGEPPAPPLKQIEVVRIGGGWRYALISMLSAAAGVAATLAVLR
ncbi:MULTISPECIES: 2-polyprenylphenol 6-hydroxylase [Sphingomonas]|jgi:ubiquinone biosynthesis protein|uniref:2-polyprenylphenol 6-hydroxylase n=1 Tax=Sphingomonas zeae TaxID=1646122 RepID=A0A7Y6EFW2_9SPHN|nr:MULTISPECIES: 2-polyprenylphenol 6-hydroxylase [Sphingomonas]MBB4048494.1 ubiquinone biosynthesis protein [Sphingomonas zeae]MDK8187495.1 2-polyprenylphenol 6-hydroxylase [Sphingomonas zeae]MDK8217229.1 2-polyprenylphenol 6-hydroxylase [Sphingomonas sp. UMB7805-LC452B]NUU46178.1 2-polyprenylphenol 6-hydroxylase [Sphingomonas zeae]